MCGKFCYRILLETLVTLLTHLFAFLIVARLLARQTSDSPPIHAHLLLSVWTSFAWSLRKFSLSLPLPLSPSLSLILARFFISLRKPQNKRNTACLPRVAYVFAISTVHLSPEIYNLSRIRFSAQFRTIDCRIDRIERASTSRHVYPINGARRSLLSAIIVCWLDNAQVIKKWLLSITSLENVAVSQLCRGCCNDCNTLNVRIKYQ